MRKAVICAIAVSCAALWAQEEKREAATAPVPAVRVFQLKPGNLKRVIGAVGLIAGENNVRTNGENTIVVKTIPEYMPAVEKVVRELDLPPAAHNVELTFYILQGSREPLAEAAAIPPELQATAAQLKSAFGFQGFRLFDTAVIRLRDGKEGMVKGNFAIPGKDQPALYSIYLTASVVAEAKPVVVRLDTLRFNATAQQSQVGFDANIDIKEGQKVVVGKSGIDGNQSAVILVCTTRLVD